MLALPQTQKGSSLPTIALCYPSLFAHDETLLIKSRTSNSPESILLIWALPLPLQVIATCGFALSRITFYNWWPMNEGRLSIPTPSNTWIPGLEVSANTVCQHNYPLRTVDAPDDVFSQSFIGDMMDEIQNSAVIFQAEEKRRKNTWRWYWWQKKETITLKERILRKSENQQSCLVSPYQSVSSSQNKSTARNASNVQCDIDRSDDFGARMAKTEIKREEMDSSLTKTLTIFCFSFRKLQGEHQEQ